MLLAKPGVYLLYNTIEEKGYVGSSTKSVRCRVKDHKNGLRKGTHCNTRLQKAFDRYGVESFECVALIYCKPHRCLKHEQKFIDQYKTYDPKNGYNICQKAGNTTGRKLSKAHIQRLREANSGPRPESFGLIMKLTWRNDPNIKKKHRASLLKHWEEHPERKKTIHKPVGVLNGCCQLTVEQVLRIRELDKTQSRKKIASFYGISTNHVGAIVRKEKWKHV